MMRAAAPWNPFVKSRQAEPRISFQALKLQAHMAENPIRFANECSYPSGINRCALKCDLQCLLGEISSQLFTSPCGKDNRTMSGPLRLWHIPRVNL